VRKKVKKFGSSILVEIMNTNGDKKGLALVAVLWIVAVLIILAAATGQTSRLDTKICRGVRTEQLRCKWSCRAGIEKAIAILNEDKELGTSDSLTDLWSQNEEDLSNIMLERCRFDVRVVDETSKLNVNTATKEQLMGLWYMTEEIAAAIIDWRDQNEDQEAGGVERGYYENMPFGYKIRNGPFRTIRELLLVKDVTPELFYGEDTNFNGQLDYNERDGDISPPADDKDDELDEGWIAHLTCYSSGGNVSGSGQTSAKVNVNTAPYRVLAALLGGGDDAERTAHSIIAHRETLADGIQNISELESAAVVDNDTFEKIQDYLTTSSNVFTIRSIATADRSGLNGATLLTEVVVDRSSTPCKILFWYQGANN
jgi:type II secretory pathway component PulK